jgi:hypothetical protein
MEPMTTTEVEIKTLSHTSSDDYTVTTDFDLESGIDNDDPNAIDNDNDSIIQDYKKEVLRLENKVIVDKFIKHVISSTKDLVFVYIVLKKCFDCGLFTKSQYQNYVLESFSQTSIVIDTMESTSTGHGVGRQQEKEHFNYLLETCPFISEAELQKFLDQKLNDVEMIDSSSVDNENELGDQVSSTVLKRNENNDDLFMTECFDTMMTMSCHGLTSNARNVRIDALCSIASLIYNSISTDSPTDIDSTDRLFTTDETSSTLPRIPSQVSQIIDFGNQEQIESVMKSVTIGFESIIGTRLSKYMEYVDNLELDAIMDADHITFSMSDFNDIDEGENFYGPIETASKLKIAMIYVVLSKLDDKYDKKDIKSVIEIIAEHPSIASIQEKGCEKLANLLVSKTRNVSSNFSYEESQRITNIMVEAMTNHQDIVNIQKFGYDVIKCLMNQISGNQNDKARSLHDMNCCMNIVLRLFRTKN